MAENLESRFATTEGDSVSNPQSTAIPTTPATTSSQNGTGITVMNTTTTSFKSYLLDQVNSKTIQELDRNLKQAASLNVKLRRQQSLSNLAISEIERRFKVMKIPDWQNWLTWSDEILIQNLTKAYGDSTYMANSTPFDYFVANIKNLEFKFDPNDSSSYAPYTQGVDSLMRTSGAEDLPFTAEQQTAAVKALVDNLRHANQHSIYKGTVAAIKNQLKVEIAIMATVDDYLTKLTELCMGIVTLVSQCAKYELPGHTFVSSNDSWKGKDKNSRPPNQGNGKRKAGRG